MHPERMRILGRRTMTGNQVEKGGRWDEEIGWGGLELIGHGD